MDGAATGSGRAKVENQYGRAVRPEGNPAVEEADRRGVRDLRPQVARRRHHPQERLQAALRVSRPRCRAAVRGRATSRRRNRPSASAARSCEGSKKPHDCPAFGKTCTPQTPLGATMVSARRGVRRLLRVRPASGGEGGADAAAKPRHRNSFRSEADDDDAGSRESRRSGGRARPTFAPGELAGEGDAAVPRGRRHSRSNSSPRTRRRSPPAARRWPGV